MATQAVPLNNRKNVVVESLWLSSSLLLLMRICRQARQGCEHKNRTKNPALVRTKRHYRSLDARNKRSTAAASTVYYFSDSAAGSSQEKRKPLISGNCAASRPKAGTTIKAPILIQKAMPSSPGLVSVIRLSVASRCMPE